MTVLKYIRLPFLFNVEQLQQEVNAIALQHWQLHYQTLHYEGNWSAIPLRSVEGKTDDIFISPYQNAVYSDTAFLQKSNYLKEVLSSFHCPLLAVRLLKLDAGAVIKEHRDADLAFENGEMRIHIPVTTNEKVEFYLDKERMYLKNGECWYMNFNLPHSIINNSSEDRVHLVIDAKVNAWAEELFSQPSPHKKETEEAGYDAATKQQIIKQLRAMNTDTANKLADEMENSLHNT
jgi:mannose-6-phosphate isomerase-like protein (cupin superfamily)